MGPVGMQEMIVIFLVALLLFGPRKLPELGKTLAKAMSEFRRAQSDLKATFEREMANIERENESLKETTKQAAAEISGYSDFDLIGGENHYASQFSGETAVTAPAAESTHPATAEASASEPSTVSASEVASAESPAESTAAPETAPSEAAPVTAPRIASAEGTVPRNGVAGTATETQSAPEAAVNS
jgi:TatA/E family protein of Tat protein translocase